MQLLANSRKYIPDVPSNQGRKTTELDVSEFNH